MYLHLIPIFGVILSLWSLYGKPGLADEDLATQEATQDSEAFAETAIVNSASRLSVMLGLICMGAIASLGAGAYTQPGQIAHLRFLFASSFVGSSYFLLSLALMFRIAKDQSIRLPGLRQLSRRLP
jgi:hypothetical protein